MCSIGGLGREKNHLAISVSTVLSATGSLILKNRDSYSAILERGAVLLLVTRDNKYRRTKSDVLVLLLQHLFFSPSKPKTVSRPVG